MPAVAVIIVCHNAGADLNRCLAALDAGSLRPVHICIVDAGSDATAYLDTLRQRSGVQCIEADNIGYGRANNLGYGACPRDIDHILFLNPDCFVLPDTLERALQLLVQDEGLGCVGARLLGYDRAGKRSSGLLDSTGIVRAWYGRWHDRGQGEADAGQYMAVEEMPALCGAFLCCRRRALEAVALAPGEIFDPAFFLYKEDIELCLRLRAAGWRLLYHPGVRAWHCRGWGKKRQAVAYRLRLMAAANEVLLYRRHPSAYILWALGKYLLVRWARL